MRKLGVMVDSLAAGQLAHDLIRSGNLLVGADHLADVVAFFEEQARPCLTMNFACMHAAEVYSYDGPVVATSLSTATRLLSSPCPRARAFYVWDLEWLRLGRFRHGDLRRVYADPTLLLMARCEAHARLLRDCWGAARVEVVGDVDLERMLKLVS
jgi:hypothetical protein